MYHLGTQTTKCMYRQGRRSRRAPHSQSNFTETISHLTNLKACLHLSQIESTLIHFDCLTLWNEFSLTVNTISLTHDKLYPFTQVTGFLSEFGQRRRGQTRVRRILGMQYDLQGGKPWPRGVKCPPPFSLAPFSECSPGRDQSRFDPHPIH